MYMLSADVLIYQTCLFFISQEAGHRALWSVNGPRILEVGYEDEEDPAVMEAYEQIGSLVIFLFFHDMIVIFFQSILQCASDLFVNNVPSCQQLQYVL